MKSMAQSLIFQAYQENGLKILDDFSSYFKTPIRKPNMTISDYEYIDIEKKFLLGNYRYSVFDTESKPIIFIADIPLIKVLTHLCFGGDALVEMSKNLALSEEFISDWFAKKWAEMTAPFYKLRLKKVETSIEVIHCFDQKEKVMLIQFPIILGHEFIGNAIFIESKEG